MCVNTSFLGLVLRDKILLYFCNTSSRFGTLSEFLHVLWMFRHNFFDLESKQVSAGFNGQFLHYQLLSALINTYECVAVFLHRRRLQPCYLLFQAFFVWIVCLPLFLPILSATRAICCLCGRCCCFLFSFQFHLVTVFVSLYESLSI